jgi:hypothetical protein
MATLQQLKNKSFSYNDTNKDQLHRAGKKALKALAAKLELPEGSFEVRSNKGGIAVSGEVTLHSDNLYVQISESFNGRGLQVMFRTCKGRKDYSGGQNNFADIDRFESDSFVSQLKKMSAVAA